MRRLFSFGLKLLEEQNVVVLIERARGGDRAAREQAFWGLARLIPQALWALRERGQSGDLEDLESVGAVALLEAIDAYSLDCRVSIRSFAYMRIRGALLDHIMARDLQGGRLPRPGENIYLWVKRTQSRLLRTLGRLPGVEEILAADDLPSTLAAMRPATRAAQVGGILAARRGAVSLDRLIEGEGDDEERDLKELRSPVVPGPEEIAEARLMRPARRRAVRGALARLTALQRDAVERGYLTKRQAGGCEVSPAARSDGTERGTMSKRRESGLRRLKKMARYLREYI